MEYFKGIKEIKYEGPKSTNPLAFKFYNPNEIVNGKTMEDHLRFSVAFWHTFNGRGKDPFGDETFKRKWDNLKGLDLAKARVEIAFEFLGKLNIPFFSFHDVDIAPEGNTLAETNKNIDTIVTMMKGFMDDSKVELLWNTSNAFTNPMFVHGAATSNNADVFAYTAAKVKKGLEVAKELRAKNYVFWGGREGYESLLNTNMSLEEENLARLLSMASDYANEISFEGSLLIEPKPKEPMKHQYDFDVATSIAFLRKYGLENKFKFNIEANHATLAGHTFEHELRVARINNMLGSVDANQGDDLLGWDTDEFPTDLYATTLSMYEILQNGGLGKGGLNFDAKLKRSSLKLEDLFYAHIVGMDSFAVGLKVAQKLIDDKIIDSVISERYSSFNQGIGKEIVSGNTNLHVLEQYALNLRTIENNSGEIERLRGLINQYIITTF